MLKDNDPQLRRRLATTVVSGPLRSRLHHSQCIYSILFPSFFSATFHPFQNSQFSGFMSHHHRPQWRRHFRRQLFLIFKGKCFSFCCWGIKHERPQELFSEEAWFTKGWHVRGPRRVCSGAEGGAPDAADVFNFFKINEKLRYLIILIENLQFFPKSVQMFIKFFPKIWGKSR